MVPWFRFLLSDCWECWRPAAVWCWCLVRVSDEARYASGGGQSGIGHRQREGQELPPVRRVLSWCPVCLESGFDGVVGGVVAFDRCRVVDGVLDAVQVAADGFGSEEGCHDGD